MKLSKVWNSLRGVGTSRKQAATAQRVSAHVESMEARQLLSAASLFIPATGELNIQLNSNDNVRVSSVGGAVVVEIGANGGPLTPLTSLGTVASANVISIVVLGGDDANTIDLNGVTAAGFPALTSISVDAANGHDTIIGSPDLADNIIGGHGDDTISSQGGNDTISGGDGNDLISGGTGNDSINSGDGDDVVNGEDGDDVVTLGNGQDTLNGGNGNDSCFAGNGQDLLNGDAGNDTLNGDGGTDTVNGGDDNDSILGGEFADNLNGDAGNDTINGQGGNDSVDGGSGDDSLLGGVGNDAILGNSGNDRINGNAGVDSLDGGAGDDSVLGGAGNDSLAGGPGSDTLDGQAGNDTVQGDADNDVIRGGDGNDLLISGADSEVTLGVSVGNVSLQETNGATTATFLVTLDFASVLPVSVNYATADGTATAGSDYTSTTGQLVFQPGQTSLSVTVPVAGDTSGEADETFFLNLSNPINVALANTQGVATIVNDDSTGLFGVTFSAAQLFSFDANTAASTLIGTMTNSPAGGIAIAPDGTAYVIQHGSTNLYTVNLTTGVSTLVGPLGVGFAEGDIAYDSVNNVLYATFGGESPANLYQINPTTGVGTNLGTLQRNGANVDGNIDGLSFRNGTLYAVATIGSSGGAIDNSLLTIDVTTRNTTLVGNLGVTFANALAGLAYDSATDTFVGGGPFAGGDRLFRVNPTTGVATDIGPTGTSELAGLAFRGSSGGTVQPALSISDVTVLEGNTGTTAAQFTVTLSQALTSAVTFDFATVSGTATAGVDFVSSNGSLTIPAGSTTATITVTVNGDLIGENNQTFLVNLSNAVGAVFADSQGVGRITNDDVLSISSDTFLGGAGDDTVLAGNGNDVINGGDGSDQLLGGGGNDLIAGGAGPDTLDGQAGDDTLDGQGGDDVLLGGDGNDIFISTGTGAGNDTVDGGDGFNGIVVNGNNNADTITVTAPNGAITVTNAGATIEVGANVQVVTVNGLGNDDLITIGDLSSVGQTLLVVNGGEGNDTITGQGAGIGGVRVLLNGDNGNDTIVGTEGNDSINGGAGNDAINGRAGNDIITGADGNDILAGAAGNDTVLGGTGSDFLTGQTGDDSIVGGDGNDTLRGFEGNDTLLGQSGDDLLNGMDGDDSILGGVGQDSLTGGSGNDVLDGGRNNDTINGNSGNDLIRGDHGNDYINAGTESDTVNGGDGHDTIIATDGLDLLNGGDGNDAINAGGGNDIISGGDGNDTLLGGGGSDVILGGDGEDQINGQGGTDTIAGNQGIDTIADPASEIDEAFTLSAALLTALEAVG